MWNTSTAYISRQGDLWQHQSTLLATPSGVVNTLFLDVRDLDHGRYDLALFYVYLRRLKCFTATRSREKRTLNYYQFIRYLR